MDTSNLIDGIYHAEVFKPALMVRTGHITLGYTTHALRAAMDDKYSDKTIKIPRSLYITSDMIKEVYVVEGQVNKMTVQVEYNDRYNLALVINPNTDTVITLWLNKKTDKHEQVTCNPNQTRYVTGASYV